ncbi:MAG: hypothetical protein CM15mL9_190 [uncultured marine virus]|nr:MAG: hypothetical protein CM15mL9_190 [uncultured marine virus]
MSLNWIWNFAVTDSEPELAEKFYNIYLDELEKQKSK